MSPNLCVRALERGLLLLAAAAWLAGCGPAVPEVKLTPVTGKVTMDGKPLEGAAVVFTPVQGTLGTGAYGVTDAEGKFSLTHQTKKPGIEPGRYAVTFSKMAMKDGSPIPEGKTAADVEAVQVIPPAYAVHAPDSNLNVVAVDAKGGAFDFDIPAK